MKKIIQILNDDHSKIKDAILALEDLMALPPEKSLDNIAKSLMFFKDFTFQGHHKREEEILYAWMKGQNPNSDTALMDRIKNDHTQLEMLGDKILKNINSHLNKEPNATIVTIMSDLDNFVLNYVEHIVKEENFIFMIAESLQLTDQQKNEMLLRMQQTLK